METLTESSTSVGFTSGRCFVVGDWTTSPVGAPSGVMWAPPDGERILVAPGKAADFVVSVYPFDEARVQSAAAAIEARRMIVSAGDLRLSVDLGRITVPFPPRPRWITSTVENCRSRPVAQGASLASP